MIARPSRAIVDKRLIPDALLIGLAAQPVEHVPINSQRDGLAGHATQERATDALHALELRLGRFRDVRDVDRGIGWLWQSR
jgi:hypothetical protein